MNDNNYEEELTYIIYQKKKANSLINTNLSESLSVYNELKELIEKLKENSKDEQSSNLQEIFNQYILILSNIAMVYHRRREYNSAVKYDRKVIALDKLFDKSYARLIDSYMKMDNFNLARYFYSLMKSTFSEQTLKRYEDIITNIEKQIEEKDSYINSLKSIFMSK